MTGKRFLLDTHIILWWMTDNKRLSKDALHLLSNPDNVIFVSSISIWELAIKISLGKLDMSPQFFVLLEQESFKELPITHKHALGLIDLPKIHRDPFDRMLIAQARVEKMTLITTDKDILRYDIITLKV